ncbi:GGDEF domain-containing protein [Agrobacterium vitis]|uniref:GGDEF domain-containing protein n=1 Tax=Agrobacterium vitis TaxID=373 RepID=UPI001F2B6635|nr:GGDEF domain-containing protein [Agrobacterium vitis]MCF1470186.1 GGDEF domain-containing protein [Agrobacterium vitis]
MRFTPLHALLYQTPFTIIVLNSAYVVFTSRRAMWGDRLLYTLLLVTGLHFFAKAAAAVLLGSGKTAKDYIGTSYALVSQSLTAVLMVAVGLALLSVLVLEVMKTSRQESETDFLSGLANRRGFHRKVENLAAEMPEGPHAIIICDLDHFKKVNDLYGHVVGDLVIEGFGQQLRAFAPDGAILGRMGGEEFAIILPKTEIDRAVQFAQLLRNRMAKIPNLPSTLQVTASLGVSSMTAEIEFSDAYRQADTALYNAKAAGRNRVKIAKGSALRVS